MILIKLIFGPVNGKYPSWEINKVYHPNLFFNKSTVQQISSQKHLWIHLDEELTFKHINEKINNANKSIGIICKLSNILP